MIKQSNSSILSNILNQKGITINLANNHQITAIGTGKLHNLTPVPIKANILADKDLHQSLISVHDLTSQNCKVVFTSTSMEIINKPSGEINNYLKYKSTNMWTLPLTDMSTNVVSSPTPGFEMIPTQDPYGIIIEIMLLYIIN